MTGKSVAERFVPAALLLLQKQRWSQGGDSSEIMADKYRYIVLQFVVTCYTFVEIQI